MGKIKGVRILVILRCNNCTKVGTRNRINYFTTKNRRNTTARLELKKFCPKCNSHTQQKEIK